MQTQALYRIGKGEAPAIPYSLSKRARDFISQCVNPNAEDRPSASELLEHPFVNGSISLYKPVCKTQSRRQTFSIRTVGASIH